MHTNTAPTALNIPNLNVKKLYPELFQITKKNLWEEEFIFKDNRSHSVLKQTKLRKDKQKKGANNRKRTKEKRDYILSEK